VETLPEDLGEHKWKEFPKASLANLLNYMVRQGYKIILHEIHDQLTLWMQKMIIVSFDPNHLQFLMNWLWHASKPKKITTLICFILNKGLQTSFWLTKMHLDFICPFCNRGKTIWLWMKEKIFHIYWISLQEYLYPRSKQLSGYPKR
jgi:hypothetical protein